jgi:hypothetical protein
MAAYREDFVAWFILPYTELSPKLHLSELRVILVLYLLNNCLQNF